MISEEREDERGRFNLLWALAASIALHAALLPLGFWVTGAQSHVLQPQRAERELVVTSTAVRIERRPVPQPQRPIARPQVQHVPRPPQPQRAAPPRPAFHELAKLEPTASPQPTPQKTPLRPKETTLQQQIAEQERVYSQEVAQLNHQNNPLSIATPAHEPAASYRRSYFDAPGRAQRNVVQAVLTPLRHWYERGMSCYYARYDAEYATGGNEEGVIPWPVCYPQYDDRMAHPPYPHALPIPVPQADYVLPSGTYLTPLLRAVYNLRGNP